MILAAEAIVVAWSVELTIGESIMEGLMES